MLFATSKIDSPSIAGAFLLNGLVFTHVSDLVGGFVHSQYETFMGPVALPRRPQRMNGWKNMGRLK